MRGVRTTRAGLCSYVMHYLAQVRLAPAAFIAVVALALTQGAGAPSASAHPLGNFSVNHLSTVSVSDDEVRVRYVLDQAEIPTVQEDGLSRAEVLQRKREEVARGLTLEVNGRGVPLTIEPGARIALRPGAGGLDTTRVELELTAAVRDPRRVTVRDDTFEGRIGWKAIVSRPGEGTAVRTDAPTGDPTKGLRLYPRDLLDSPVDRREATFTVKPGDGTLVAPSTDGERVSAARTAGDGFAGLFEDAASGEGVLLILLLAAFGWGAFHAISPGHGKAMVAAYLVGTRGTARHAIALGATVTVTHTIGVFALGVVTLALSQYVLPEDLYPWLTLISGLMVLGIGAGVLRSRIRFARRAHAHHHEHAPHGHTHPHGHDHHHANDLSWRGLLGMGAAAGLIPCPSALVVLLAAIAQHEIGLGLLLIVAFSLGLAGTLTGLGLAVVYARRLIPSSLAAGRLITALPAASALLIVAVGAALTAKAVPGVV